MMYKELRFEIRYSIGCLQFSFSVFKLSKYTEAQTKHDKKLKHYLPLFSIVFDLRKRQHVDGLHVARVIKNWRITTNCAGCVTRICN